MQKQAYKRKKHYFIVKYIIKMNIMASQKILQLFMYFTIII